VVEPATCGVGGYGRLALFLAGPNRFVTVDHYVRAPAAARPDMFEIDPDRPDKYYGFPHTKGLRAELGPLAPAVPGAVAGLCAAHARFGRLPLARVLEPAIGYAEAGVPVDWSLQLAIAGRLADIRAHPQAAAWLLRDGVPPAIPGQQGGGDRLDTAALAATLKRIAAHGAAGFHEGQVAAALAGACAMLTAADLAAYRPRFVEEPPANYRGLDYITAWDQVGTEALNILANFDLAAHGPDSLEFRHLAVEALACAFADNMTHYGDPEHERAPVHGLAHPGFAAARAAGLRLDRALPRPVAAADPWPWEQGESAPPRPPGQARLAGTSQMVAADRDGNCAALITSLTSSFGSLVYVPEVGVMLNNSMQNFDPRPGTANCIRPGKMPIFAAPAIAAARHGRARFAAAGSGGYRIEAGVLHTMIHAVDFGMSVQAALDAPRVHCQGNETIVDARIPDNVRAALSDLGHRVVVQRDQPGFNAFGRVAAIHVDPRDGSLHAGSFPPWGSAAAAF
jgi:gamma-glutamyltranspeptidase/glutathione hydrolase